MVSLSFAECNALRKKISTINYSLPVIFSVKGEDASLQIIRFIESFYQFTDIYHLQQSEKKP